MPKKKQKKSLVKPIPAIELQLCSIGHGAVSFVGPNCPACNLIERFEESIRDLNNELEDAYDELRLYQSKL